MNAAKIDRAVAMASERELAERVSELCELLRKPVRSMNSQVRAEYIATVGRLNVRRARLRATLGL